MLVNQKQINKNKLFNKAGGMANESRFGGTERELRIHKVLQVPSVNTDNAVRFEQGWNNTARNNDVVRITIEERSVIVTRDELEQALAYMSQGDELIKFAPPKLRPAGA